LRVLHLGELEVGELRTGWHDAFLLMPWL
jgi:hypothetical protein